MLDKTDYPTKEWIEKVVILGPPSGIKGAKVSSKSKYFILLYNTAFFFCYSIASSESLIFDIYKKYKYIVNFSPDIAKME